MEHFGVFRNYLKSLEHRKNRLQLERISVHADMLKERCSDSGVSFNALMQADFILYLCDAIQAISEDRYQEWWPETLLFKSYNSSAFEIFLRSESVEYFKKLAKLFGIQRPSDLQSIVNKLENESMMVPKWRFERVDLLKLMNYQRLCIRP